MKYSVIYSVFGTTYQAHFDTIEDAKLFALLKDLQVDCNLHEHKEGEFNKEDGYFSGTVTQLTYK